MPSALQDCRRCRRNANWAASPKARGRSSVASWPSLHWSAVCCRPRAWWMPIRLAPTRKTNALKRNPKWWSAALLSSTGSSCTMPRRANCYETSATPCHVSAWPESIRALAWPLSSPRPTGRDAASPFVWKGPSNVPSVHEQVSSPLRLAIFVDQSPVDVSAPVPRQLQLTGTDQIEYLTVDLDLHFQGRTAIF